MKITHIETYPVRIPLKPTRHMITALGRHTESLYLLDRVGTDAGIGGVGDAKVMPTWSSETVWGSRALTEQVFAPLLIGVDPCAIEEVRIVKEPMAIEGPVVTVPDRPGLGVEVDWGLVREHLC